MKTCIIIPTYNERYTIASLIEALLVYTPHVSIIVIDDNSPDGTANIVKRYIKSYPAYIHLISRERKLGLGSAYIVGFTYALKYQADVIFEMDADGSHSPRDVPRMIKQIQQGADVVIGSRRIQGGAITGWGIHRRIASWGAMTVARIVLGLKTKDVTAGFRAYKSNVLRNLQLDTIKSNGYAFQEEMVYLCECAGYVIKEIPVTFTDRKTGVSKLSTKDIIEFFLTIFRLRFHK